MQDHGISPPYKGDSPNLVNKAGGIMNENLVVMRAEAAARVDPTVEVEAGVVVIIVVINVDTLIMRYLTVNNYVVVVDELVPNRVVAYTRLFVFQRVRPLLEAVAISCSTIVCTAVALSRQIFILNPAGPNRVLQGPYKSLV